MQKIRLLLCFLILGFAAATQATVQPLSVVYRLESPVSQSVFIKKMPKTPAQKWAMAGLIVLLVIGIALTILGLVVFGLLIRDGFDGGHLGSLPTIAAAVFLILGLLASIFSGKKIKKLKGV
jgi:hypothetical protein